jgi:hypothetical protein
LREAAAHRKSIGRNSLAQMGGSTLLDDFPPPPAHSICDAVYTTRWNNVVVVVDDDVSKWLFQFLFFFQLRDDESEISNF